MTKRPRRDWTDAEYKDVKELLRLGVTQVEVARRYDVTVTSLLRFIQRCDSNNGKHKPRHSFWIVPGRSEAVIKMWKAGQDATEIARALGTTRGTIIGKIRRAGLLEKQRGDSTVDVKNKMRLSNLRRAVQVASIKRGELATGNTANAGVSKPWSERTFGQCAFIVSGVGADSIACCAPRVPSLKWPYCEEHAAVMFVER